MFKSSFFLGLANIAMAAVPLCAIAAMGFSQPGLLG
jgi:hypothetical protein